MKAGAARSAARTWWWRRCSRRLRPRCGRLLDSTRMIAPLHQCGAAVIDVDAHSAPASRRVPDRRARPTTILRAPAMRSAGRMSQELLAAGICVITTINIQYIAEQQEQRGGDHRQARRRDRARVILIRPRTRSRSSMRRRSADTFPRTASMRPMPRTAQQLSELREIAPAVCGRRGRPAAGGVPPAAAASSRSFGTHERILVCVTPRANASTMIASGQAQRGSVSRGTRCRLRRAARLTPEDRGRPGAESLDRPRERRASRDPGRARIRSTAILRFARERRHHTDLRRTQPAARLVAAPAAGSHVDRLIRRREGHRRPHLPALM